MKRLLFVAFAVPLLHAADEPAASLRETVNGLEPAQIEKAVAGLQSHFLSPQALDETSKQKALLEGLIRRLSPGVAIVSSEKVSADIKPVPFLAEILDDRAGYLRPGNLDPATLAQLDTALASFSEKKLPAVILDLRAVPGGSALDGAADFARRFSPNGKILFTIQKPSAKQERILTSNQSPAYQGILVVLTDGNTSGAAEILAATLRFNARAMIIGSDTAGEAVEFTEIPLGGGKNLRIAVSQAILPDKSAIFPGGVKPDVAVSLPPADLEKIFEASRDKGVSQFVFESGRPRMNEAALIANTNPEIDGSKDLEEPPLRDTVLQRAMDLVTAIAFYNKHN